MNSTKWYLLTPAGWAGPFDSRAEALAAGSALGWSRVRRGDQQDD